MAAIQVEFRRLYTLESNFSTVTMEKFYNDMANLKQII